LWFQLNAIKKGASRPAGVPASKVNKLGILGAGMMGGGIAYVSAQADIDVRLIDTTEERDGMRASGMERGVNETYARLDGLFARLASS